MTHAPYVPPASYESLEAAIDSIRRRGLRLSAVRRRVLEALFVAEGPLSSERLARVLKLDLTSVYRNLESMERLGMVHHVHLGHGPGLYALTGRGEGGYLYCEHCGSVRAVSSDELHPVRATLRERFGYEARFAHFPIVGLCHECVHGVHMKGPDQGAKMSQDEHSHEHAHSHEHSHDGETHEHPHTSHEHEHTEHEHEHSHGDHVHSHAHAHEKGLEEDHSHSH